MTKRDVAVWFCKVVALVGMIGAIFSAINGLLSWSIFGVSGLWRPILSFGLYLFVWFFARGIGTELAAEGEFGAPITSGADPGSLLLRCAGLWIFLAAAINFGPLFLNWTYEHFFAKGSSSSMAERFLITNLIVGFAQSVFGFLLAFTPRIRRFLGK